MASPGVLPVTIQVLVGYQTNQVRTPGPFPKTSGPTPNLYREITYTPD